MVWKPAHFHKVVKANQYENVIVRWNVGPDRKLPDLRRSGACGQGGRRNEGAQRAARRQRPGAKPSGKKPAAKKSAAKKTAPKKAAAKKAAPKKKSAAKKKPAKAKKATKKVAKKAAKKKTAKKTSFKKMMGRLVKRFTPAKKKEAGADRAVDGQVRCCDNRSSRSGSMARLIVLLLLLLLATPARTQDALVTYKSLNPEVALDLARAALFSRPERGFQVAVAVVDRFGVTQVLLRDRFAGAHTVGDGDWQVCGNCRRAPA